MYSNYHLYKIPYIYIDSVPKMTMMHDGHVCLLPNQKIICNDITKNIEDIKFGDKVLTHKGRFSKVIGTSERHYDGKINIIRTKKFNFNLKATEDHPVLVAIPNIIIDEKSRNVNTKWKVEEDEILVKNMIYGRKSNIDLDKSLTQCKQRYYWIKKYIKKDFIFMWKNAFAVDETDFFVFPIIKDIDEKIENRTQHRCIYCKSERLLKKGFTPNGSRRWLCVKCKKSFIDKFMHCNVLDDLYDKDLCYLIGLFLADGCANVRSGKLRFFVDNRFKDKVCDKIKKVFKIEPKIYSITGTDKCYDISVHSMKLTRLFNKLGKNENKHPMKEILTMPLEYQESFLEGYEDGDGCKQIDYKSGYKKRESMSISTISASNLFALVQILLRKGIVPSVSERQRVKYNNYKEKLNGSVYMIAYGKGNTHGLRGIIHGDNLLLPVKSNITQEYSGMVYNLNVENDNTFVGLNGVVHNCLDEMWSILDARASNTTRNKIVSDIILRSRKRELQYIFTAQLLDLLDKRVRKLLDFTAYTVLSRMETLGKCFREGTQIIANPEIKNIENVEIGEKVLTHNGNFMPVENTSCRFYDGSLFKILPYYMPFPVEVTGNHPILVAEPSFKKSKKTNWHNDDKFLIDNFFILDSHEMIDKLDRTCESIRAKKTRLKKNISFSLKWKNAEEITKKDLLAYPIIKNTVDKKYIKISDFLDKKEWKTKRYKAKSWAGIKGCILENGIWKNNRNGLMLKDEIKIDNDFLKLAGYYIGDGAVQGYGRNVAFYFNRKEKGNILEVRRLMKNVFGLECKIYENKNSQETFVYVHCILLAKLFLKLFGKYSHNKKMPEWFLLLPEEKLKYVIEGLVLSDGYIRKKTKIITTTSKILAIQIINSLIRMKKGFNCYHSKPKSSKKVNAINDVYSIAFDVKYSKFLFFHGDYILYPIKLIEKNNYLGMVYNLQVQNDESYVTPSLTAHNCFIFRGGYPKEQMLLKSFQFYTSGVFQLYNHREEIDMKEEDDGSPPLIVFQESPEHPPKYFDTYEACDKFAETYYAKHPELLSLLMAGQ